MAIKNKFRRYYAFTFLAMLTLICSANGQSGNADDEKGRCRNIVLTRTNTDDFNDTIFEIRIEINDANGYYLANINYIILPMTLENLEAINRNGGSAYGVIFSKANKYYENKLFRPDDFDALYLYTRKIIEDKTPRPDFADEPSSFYIELDGDPTLHFGGGISSRAPEYFKIADILSRSDIDLKLTGTESIFSLQQCKK